MASQATEATDEYSTAFVAANIPVGRLRTGRCTRWREPSVSSS